MTAQNLIPLGDMTPRGEEKSKKRHKKKRDGGKENGCGASTEGSQQDNGLAPIQFSRSGKVTGIVSPGRADKDKKGVFAISKPAPGDQTRLLDGLPKVERRGFDVEAKLFQQVQKEYEEARKKKTLNFDITDRSKHNAVGPLLAAKRESSSAPLEKIAKSAIAGLGLTGAADDSKLEMNKKSVLPCIPTTQANDACSSQPAEASTNNGNEGAGRSLRSVAEVHSMLPVEYSELKQMMELHRELKSQMARNKEQIQKLQEQTSGEEAGEGGEMMDLLRQQSSHVVMMMKDVLDRMESYPEQLWALYGAVEAYEQCSNNRGKLENNEAIKAKEDSLGPSTVQEHEEALADIYSHILEAVNNFLNLNWRSD